ncbi:drug resistance translocase [Bordetella pertussis]|nr:drug resistance translocase [Bordetella pertussis]
MSRAASAPSYSLMMVMLGLLSCVAPASIDAYLPAFGALQREFGVPQETVQLTLGVYMFCYAAMLLLHGTLSDSLGRRRVVLGALGFYVWGALLCHGRTRFWLAAGGPGPAGTVRRRRGRGRTGHHPRLLSGRSGTTQHVLSDPGVQSIARARARHRRSIGRPSWLAFDLLHVGASGRHCPDPMRLAPTRNARARQAPNALLAGSGRGLS